MKFLFTVLPMWFLACLACAVNSLEQEFLCPVCGTHWAQRIETSGHSRGLRLDLRQLGDVQDPPTLPQCTKCRFPLFSDRLLAQANDPAKQKSFKRLRTFVLGADFQMLAAKNPSYFALAQVQKFLGEDPADPKPTPPRYLALSYLRASWQVEDRPAACRRLLEKAHEYYTAALDGLDAKGRPAGDLALLCGEVERRLEKWDHAEKRFRALESSGLFEGTPQAGLPALQLRLIARRDSAPHEIEGPELVENVPRPEREMKLENPGHIPLASARSEKPDGMKLASPPKAPEELLPIVLLEAPMPPVSPDSAPVAKPDGGTRPAPPPEAPEESPVAVPPLPLPSLKLGSIPFEKPDGVIALGSPADAAAGLFPAAPIQPPVPPVKPGSAPVEKPNAGTKPVSPPKPPEKLPAAAPPLPLVLLPFVPPLPLAVPVKPDSNFSDNPD